MVPFSCYTMISGATTNTGTSAISDVFVFLSLSHMVSWVRFGI